MSEVELEKDARDYEETKHYRHIDRTAEANVITWCETPKFEEE